jgi:hypothetical protein
MLVLITVVALAPVGIGFGVSRVAVNTGGRGTQMVLRRPPAATVEAGATSLPARLASYCWKYGSRRTCRHLASPTSGTTADLAVRPGQEVRVSFATSGGPRSVQLKLAGGVAPPPAASRVSQGNPATFTVSGSAGRRVAVITTMWAQGQVDYAVSLKVG